MANKTESWNIRSENYFTSKPPALKSLLRPVATPAILGDPTLCNNYDFFDI